MATERMNSTGPTPAGEWLFQRGGQVFGPIGSDQLIEMLAARSIGPKTLVAQDGGPWQPFEKVPQFLVEVRKAEARARVEADLATARRRARWRGALRWVGASAIVATLAVAGTRAASFVATERPWNARTALLDDFSAPVAVGTVLVSRSARAADDEVAVPSHAPHRGPRAESRAKRVAALPDAARRGQLPAERIVQAQYDPARIGEVVAQRQASLAACVREEARRSPDMRGEIPIEFAVGNDGKVSALWIHDARYKSGALHDCMFRRLQEWSFDSFQGERPIVSLAFRVGSP